MTTNNTTKVTKEEIQSAFWSAKADNASNAKAASIVLKSLPGVTLSQIIKAAKEMGM